MRFLAHSILATLLVTLAAISVPVQAATIKYSHAYSGYYAPVGNFDNAFYPDRFQADFNLNTFGGILSLRSDYAVSSLSGVIRPNGPVEAVINIYSTVALGQCADPSGYYSGLLVGATCYVPFLNYSYTLNHLTCSNGGFCHPPVVFRERIFALERSHGFADLGIVGVNLPYVPLEPIPVPAAAWSLALALALLGGWAYHQREGHVAQGAKTL